MTLRRQFEDSLSVRLSPSIRSLFAGCGNSSVLGTGHIHGEESARPQVLTGSGKFLRRSSAVRMCHEQATLFRERIPISPDGT